MKLTTILFDLDGTLLPMDNDAFTRGYFKLLAAKLAPHGYETQKLVDAIWSGTAAMVRNDGTRSNEDAFWEDFTGTYSEKAAADIPLFNEFYENEFQGAKALCGYNQKASESVRRLGEAGFRIALATNPIFPSIATESRIRWAGLEPSDFELYTTYENTGFCKPNPKYYIDVAKRLGVSAEECLMVGNDVDEDMIAVNVGMKVFLLTDCIINRNGRSIDEFPHGSFDRLMGHIAALTK